MSAPAHCPQDLFYHVIDQYARLEPEATLPEIQTLKVFYVTSFLAYQKYTKYFYMLFPNGFVNNGDSDLVDVSFQFGWLIFVYMRAKLCPRGAALRRWRMRASAWQGIGRSTH